MVSRRSVIAGTAASAAMLAAGSQILGQAASRRGITSQTPDPRLTGFHMPVESAPHERTFMQWPVSLSVYDRPALAAVQNAIADIANTIVQFEPVVMLAAKTWHSSARTKLSRKVALWDVPTEDLWCRDSGPTFVVGQGGELAVAHLRFNGWGKKQPHGNDARVAERVAARLGIDLLETGLVGEQGGVEHDGAGTLLAHASCWANRNRNRIDQAEIGKRLLTALGGTHMIWAPGIAGADITDYHIDSLARFVAPGKVLIQISDAIDRSDPWSVAAHQTLAVLQASRSASGKPLDIATLADPVTIRSESDDFVAGYINYYICNGAVICAQFGDAVADERARATLSSLYPGRAIVMLNTDALGEAGGGIHCATQQQPAVRAS